ncbi:hypothetical protein Q8F55_007612 [Vanrija albida]|uniref:Protein kinase domain-containing protein n=1 Tax=Vanrija albida TaxID=181172 RepID=A0ABR3PUA1_9TREE
MFFESLKSLKSYTRKSRQPVSQPVSSMTITEDDLVYLTCVGADFSRLTPDFFGWDGMLRASRKHEIPLLSEPAAVPAGGSAEEVQGRQLVVADGEGPPLLVGATLDDAATPARNERYLVIGADGARRTFAVLGTVPNAAPPSTGSPERAADPRLVDSGGGLEQESDMFDVHLGDEGDVSVSTKVIPALAPGGKSAEIRYSPTPSRKLGEGGYGMVYSGTVVRDGKSKSEVPAAIKEIPWDDSDEDHPEPCASFAKEVEMTRRVKRPNVVSPMAWVEDCRNGSEKSVIAYELAHGDMTALQAAAHKRNGGWRESESYLEPIVVLRMLVQILGALVKVHAAGILHRDIKPHNILLTGERGRERFLLADFGLAELLEQDGELLNDGYSGTQYFRPPEVTNNLITHVGPDFDIFSLGATAYNLLLGVGVSPIWVHENGHEYVKHDLFEARGLARVSQRTLDLLKLMLAEDREERPSAKEALNLARKALKDEEALAKVVKDPFVQKKAETSQGSRPGGWSRFVRKMFGGGAAPQRANIGLGSRVW